MGDREAFPASRHCPCSTCGVLCVHSWSNVVFLIGEETPYTSTNIRRVDDNAEVEEGRRNWERSNGTGLEVPRLITRLCHQACVRAYRIGVHVSMNVTTGLYEGGSGYSVRRPCVHLSATWMTLYPEIGLDSADPSPAAAVNLP